MEPITMAHLIENVVRWVERDIGQMDTDQAHVIRMAVIHTVDTLQEADCLPRSYLDRTDD